MGASKKEEKIIQDENKIKLKGKSISEKKIPLLHNFVTQLGSDQKCIYVIEILRTSPDCAS